MEEFNYFFKQMLSEYHILPKDLDEQNYFEFLEVINAKKPEDMLVDPMAVYQQQKGG